MGRNGLKLFSRLLHSLSNVRRMSYSSHSTVGFFNVVVERDLNDYVRVYTIMYTFYAAFSSRFRNLFSFLCI